MKAERWEEETMAVAGIDIGSSGCKIIVYDENGQYIFKVHQNYAGKRYQEQEEIDANDIWSSVRKSIIIAAQKIGNIEAITVTSFGESFVLLDEMDQVLFPVLMYTDIRGSEQATQMMKDFDFKKVAAVTGAKIHYMFSLPKLMWIKQHHADIFRKTAHILLIQDYIVYMLTGTLQIDYSIAARTLAFDIKEKRWDQELLNYSGISEKLLSRPVPSGTPAGKIKSELSERWGISDNIIIVTGCHDQVAAAVGCGIFAEGSAVDGAGTVECITPVIEGFPDSDILSEGGIAIVPYIIPNKYVCYAFSFAGGSLIKWYKDNFAKYEIILAEKKQTDSYSLLEEDIEAVPGNILVVPHFNGAATPYMDGGAKGAIIGLSLSHTAKDIYKSLMEGVAYEMLGNIMFLEKAGIKLNYLHSTGGGAKSALWMQIKANMLNKELISVQGDEAGTVGSAMLAAVALGQYKNIEDAAKKFVHMAHKYKARKDYTKQYSEQYEKYKKLYNLLKTVR